MPPHIDSSPVNPFALVRELIASELPTSVINSCLIVMESVIKQNFNSLVVVDYGSEINLPIPREQFQQLLSFSGLVKFRSGTSETKKDCDLVVGGVAFPITVPAELFVVKKDPSLFSIEELVHEAFDIWLEVIGSDSVIYSRTPTLTLSKSGRFSLLKKAFQQKIVADLSEVRMVCLGCRNSLYHMGYNNDGEETGSRYCDIKNLFINRQRVEEMMGRSTIQADYKEQLTRILLKKSQVQRIQGDGTSTSPNVLGNISVRCDENMEDDVKWW